MLMAVAVLLVGVVSWVNDGVRVGRTRSAATLADAAIEAAGPIQARAVRTGSRPATVSARRSPSATLQLALLRYSMWRTRIGWYGTVAGLLAALALCVWLALILRADWHDPLAGWIWLAIMLVLVLTFVGVRPWPAGATLIAHDPAEPAFEPPVARVEWIILAVIMVAAIVLRFWHLDSIPAGPYIDESGRALDARNLNYGLPVNRETFVFFGTGWWGVPSFYFWLVAQSMKVFGDNLLGARVVHALAGIGTVWYTYRIGRVVWSPRVGLVAGALIAVSDLAIQASRTAGESTITLFCWTACFYYLYKALKMQAAAGFRACRAGRRVRDAGLRFGETAAPLSGAGSGLSTAALGIHRDAPVSSRIALDGRGGRGRVRAEPRVPVDSKPWRHDRALQQRHDFHERSKSQAWRPVPDDNWGLILGHQYVTAYSAYDVGQEKGPFYPTGQPVLPFHGRRCGCWAQLIWCGGSEMRAMRSWACGCWPRSAGRPSP